MKSIINGFMIAIDMYSAFPMPKAERNRKNMQYVTCFFPVIGFLLGALLWVWHNACDYYGFGQACFALVGAVIPVAVTGGVHLEGFMETTDILHGKWRQKKAQDAAKQGDAHVLYKGAFAVIALACYFMLFVAGLTLIWKKEQLLLLMLSCVISRTLVGMSVAWFPAAKQGGILYSFTSVAHKQRLRTILSVALSLEFVSCVLVQPIIGAVMALAAMWVWTYYYYMARRQLGGITDNAGGYFLCLCELSSVLVIGMMGRVM